MFDASFFFVVAMVALYLLFMAIAVPVALVKLRRMREQVRGLETEVLKQKQALEVLERRVKTTPPVAEDAPVVADRIVEERPPEVAAVEEITEEAARGPWATPATEAEKAALRETVKVAEPERKTSSNYIFRAETFDGLSAWLKANWTLAIAAVSLILGGLFMVQYGVEKGLLTPTMRVIGALILGAALVAGGEALRRRFGDEAVPAVRHVPSTLAGAGVVVLFIGVLSAHALYGLIGAVPALVGVVIIAMGAVLMGWLYASVLPAVGLLGAGVAPFLVASPDADPTPFYAYFTILGLAGLTIDSFRRWAWVSGLALVVACGGLVLIHLSADLAPAFLGATLALGFGALILPERRLTPTLDGAPVSQALRGARPEFPTYLGFAGLVIPTVAAVWTATPEAPNGLGFWLSMGAFAALVAGIALWLDRAPALDEAVLLPVAGALGVLAWQGLDFGPVYESFVAFETAPPETPLPTTLWWILGLAAVMSFAAMMRAKQMAQGDSQPGDRLMWSVTGAAILPATVFLLDFIWAPREVIGASPWAFAVMATAAVLVMMTGWRARAGGADVTRDLGLLAAGAVLMIALALFLLLTKAALTLGLSVLMVLSVLLDRRFALPILGWVAQLGAAVIGYRLLVDPGLYNALYRASWGAVLISHIAALLGFAAVWRMARAERDALRAVAESAFLSTSALFLLVVIARLLDADTMSPFLAGPFAAIWASSALAQAWRLPTTSRKALRILRLVFLAVTAGTAVVLAVVQVGQLVDMMERGYFRVLGPPVVDALAFAFLPLIVVLSVGAVAFERRAKVDGVTKRLRPGLVLGVAVCGLTLFWGFVEIRRLWRGTDLSAPGPSDGELYTYTVAMLLLSLGVLAVAVVKRSELLRRIAMGGVALTILKVFLIDMGGLSGLTRVVSFVGLGLALAALAWLNRRIDAHWQAGVGASDEALPPEDEPPEPDT